MTIQSIINRANLVRKGILGLKQNYEKRQDQLLIDAAELGLECVNSFIEFLKNNENVNPDYENIKQAVFAWSFTREHPIHDMRHLYLALTNEELTIEGLEDYNV